MGVAIFNHLDLDPAKIFPPDRSLFYKSLTLKILLKAIVVWIYNKTTIR